MTFRTLILSAAVSSVALPALAQPQARQSTEKAGLAGILENDQKLLSELGRRQMMTLLNHAFDVNKVPEDQRRIYLTLASLRQLLDEKTTIPYRQQRELVANIAAGIEQVLANTNEPERLMELAATLIRAGTMRPMNLLDLDLALNRLEAQDARKAQVLEHSYFGGLSVVETGQAM